MKKLSWSENPEVTNLDTALVSLGFSYHIGEIPGVKGECYIIDNVKDIDNEFYAIKDIKSAYILYRITSRIRDSYSNLNELANQLKNNLW
jgi:hypothetical protein